MVQMHNSDPESSEILATLISETFELCISGELFYVRSSIKNEDTREGDIALVNIS